MNFDLVEKKKIWQSSTVKVWSNLKSSKPLFFSKTLANMIEEDFITMYFIRIKKIPAKHLQEHHQMQDKAS